VALSYARCSAYRRYIVARSGLRIAAMYTVRPPLPLPAATQSASARPRTTESWSVIFTQQADSLMSKKYSESGLRLVTEEAASQVTSLIGPSGS